MLPFVCSEALPQRCHLCIAKPLRFHQFLNITLVVIAVFNGASRYSFFMLKSYEKIILKELEDSKRE